MISLCMDTAYKYLSVVLIEDDKIIGQESYECFKRQSEEVFVALEKLFNDTGIKKSDIDSVCISEGPGSYTGVRIAMSIAKVLCQVKKLNLYKISTLKLYAGNNENTMVVMDARANRAYVGIYDKGNTIQEDTIKELKDIDISNLNVVLDGQLVGKQNIDPDIPNCFLATKKDWESVKEINFLCPKYLKESDSYYR